MLNNLSLIKHILHKEDFYSKSNFLKNSQKTCKLLYLPWLSFILKGPIILMLRILIQKITPRSACNHLSRFLTVSMKDPTIRFRLEGVILTATIDKCLVIIVVNFLNIILFLSVFTYAILNIFISQIICLWFFYVLIYFLYHSSSFVFLIDEKITSSRNRI